MNPTRQAETPPMTVKELRDYLALKPNKLEASCVKDDMVTWYFNNLHLITVSEESAFKSYIGQLMQYVK